MCVVMTNGECTLFPVGNPEAGSLGLIIEWSTAITAIVPSFPFSVTLPVMTPCFCPVTLRNFVIGGDCSSPEVPVPDEPAGPCGPVAPVGPCGPAGPCGPVMPQFTVS